MREDAERYYAGGRGIATLWLGLLLPPAAWLLHLSASFTVATALCGSSSLWFLHVLTVAALAVSIGGGLLAWRNWHATGEDTNPDEGGTLARSKFLALAGLASSTFFTLAILVAEVANLMLGQCTR
jgi:hypothetical protein